MPRKPRTAASKLREPDVDAGRKTTAGPDSTSHHYFAPLRNIVLTDVEEVTLGPFRLRPATRQLPASPGMMFEFTELEGLTEEVKGRLFPRMAESCFYQMAVDAPVELEYVTEREDEKEAEAQLDAMIDILRLFDFGGVTRQPANMGKRVSHREPSADNRITSFNLSGHWLPPLELRVGDLARLNEHFEQLYPFDESDQGPALRRFRAMYDRGDLVDAFIDLLICLEAIYGDSGEGIEYKVAMRAAHLLGKEPPLKVGEVYTLIRDAYSRRSQVLHGRKHDAEWVTAHLPAVWNIVRLSLRWSILLARGPGLAMRGKSFDEFCILSDFRDHKDVQP